MKDKLADLQFIKQFGTIQVKAICKRLGVNKSNIYTGKASRDNIIKVKQALIAEIEELLANV